MIMLTLLSCSLHDSSPSPSVGRPRWYVTANVKCATPAIYDSSPHLVCAVAMFGLRPHIGVHVSR
jgi:hypothetical protein